MNEEKTATLEQFNGNVENTNNTNSADYEKWEVGNTPFTIVKELDKYLVVIGKYRVSEDLATKEEAEEDAKRVDWDRMMQVMGIMIENYEEKQQK